MALVRGAGVLYAAVTSVVVAFQVALALGAPWGGYAMGGSTAGQFPPAMRVSALVQGALLLLTALVVLSRSGAAFPALSGVARWLVWVTIAIVTLSLLLNLLSRSTGERILWIPVLAAMLASSLLVALGSSVLRLR